MKKDYANEVNEYIRLLKIQKDEYFKIKKNVIKGFYSIKRTRELSRNNKFIIIKYLLAHYDIANNRLSDTSLLGDIKSIEKEIELEQFESSLSNTNISKKPKIGDYTKLDGYEFELWLSDLFHRLKYDVNVTPKSGDQGADLILKKDSIRYVVQAKKYSGAVSNSAIQEVVASKGYYQADRAIVVTTGTFTESAKQLAAANQVDLWDSEKLDTIIRGING